MTALRPCPFCGQPPRFHVRPTSLLAEAQRFIAVIACYCDGDGARRTGHGATAADAERQAAEAWNARADGAK